MPGKPCLEGQAGAFRWGGTCLPKMGSLLEKAALQLQGGRGCMDGVWREKTCLAFPGLTQLRCPSSLKASSSL